MAFYILLLLLAQVRAHDLSGSVYCSRDGEARRLSDFGAVTPIWSPDGQSICYVQQTDDESLFHLISPTGKNLETIPLPPPLTLTGGMSWHPNGKIAFAAGQGESFDIYSLNLQTGQTRQIMSDGIQPAWSPDGQLLGFTTYRDSNLEIYLADHEGRLRNLSRHDGLDARSSWEPGGTRIAFESTRFGNLEICVVDVVSGDIIRLTNDPGKDWNPAWAPDGRIAFVSDRTGETRIFTWRPTGRTSHNFPKDMRVTGSCPGHPMEKTYASYPAGRNRSLIGCSDCSD